MMEIKIGNKELPAQSVFTDWASIFQFGLSLLATLLLWGIGAIMVFAGFVQSIDPSIEIQIINTSMFVGACFLSGIIAMISALSAAGKLFGFSIEKSKWFNKFSQLIKPSILLILFPIILWIGNWVINSSELAWLLMPPIHMIATILPITWLAIISSRGITPVSFQRFWGSFGGGMMVSPPLAFIFEIIGGLFILLIVVGLISFNPDMEQFFTRTLNQISSAPLGSIQFKNLIANIFNSPIVIGASLLFIAVVTPLAEEILKPFGVWLLAGRDLTPKDGWVLGLISGAGFAFFENIWMLTADETWASLVAARGATTIIHLLTSALTGWALATAWQEKKYLKLVAIYLLSVGIHAIWNGGVLLSSLSSVISQSSRLEHAPILPPFFETLLPYLLGILALFSFIVLMLVKRNFQRGEVVEYAVVPSTDIQD
ncbi:MAG: PrsW family intramembrane metalloprotease [Chloroflexi bacterium]|jgi:hypothetical protein|nr:PrsW family intramembrane metalloprotease [Chloroflexota bacterium]MBT3670034.1 PrsW family intramembrane metalloprotease [Chloroflexota bacterium]MBT4306764.1 PrsW family intramembrane metalloprotease [Chloroflexota bacterium]MBT4532920.1 PrsW family intramembrane metalloprotease [Chloroflexota bacterium]MBT4682187.1 PrsW family intramembrane metalloprotease [Chloroflexota bacterium]